MNQLIISENLKKKSNQPLWMLVCFAMFCFWQMGFIYFIGPSLNIDGKTPLPMSVDNTATLIAICYILSILIMIFIPSKVIKIQRVATIVSLISAIALYFPLGDDALRFMIYTQVFCCCLMIGFETFIIVNLLSEHSAIEHLTFAYAIALLLIAFVQNNIFPITFATFRFLTLVSLILLLIFLFRMPATKSALPRYVTKKDQIPAPKKLLFGSVILVFVGSLMAVSGPSIAGEIANGISITYFVDAIASFIMFYLYKKKNYHPFRIMPIFMAFGCVGFLFMFVSTYIPFFAYIGCALIGIGMAANSMLPLYGSVIMRTYPSKYISPTIIGLALVAVLVQSSMVEIFRSAPTMLSLAYTVIMVILVLVYTQIEPLYLFALRKHIPNDEDEKEQIENTTTNEEVVVTEDHQPVEQEDPFSVLSPKEREVAELICLGYTNNDIAQMLFISIHTVKDHTKKIYPKMGVHNRLELATLVNKYRSNQSK